MRFSCMNDRKQKLLSNYCFIRHQPLLFPFNKVVQEPEISVIYSQKIKHTLTETGSRIIQRVTEAVKEPHFETVIFLKVLPDFLVRFSLNHGVVLVRGNQHGAAYVIRLLTNIKALYAVCKNNTLLSSENEKEHNPMLMLLRDILR